MEVQEGPVAEKSAVLQVVEDEEPEKLPCIGSNFHFVFIIDRSGSMSKNIMTGSYDRNSQKDTYIGIAVQALKLFI
jgi:hypothetical protein